MRFMKQKFRLRKQDGFALLSVLMLILVIVVVMSAAVLWIVNQDALNTSFIKNKVAKAISELGIERASQLLAEDDDWSDNAGEMYSDVSYLGGTYTVTVSEAYTNTANVSAVASYQGISNTLTKTIQRKINDDGVVEDAYYIDVDLTGTLVSGGDKVSEILLNNTHPSRDIIIDKMIVIWEEAGGPEEVETIKIDGTDRWSDVAGAWSPLGEQLSGVLYDIQDHTLNAGVSNKELIIDWTDNVEDKQFFIYLIFKDESSLNFDWQSTWSSLLQIDTSKAYHYYESGLSFGYIRYVILTNTSVSQTLNLDQLRVAWADIPTRDLKSLYFESTLDDASWHNQWDSSASSGSTIDFSDYSLNSDSAYEFRFRFNAEMEDRSIDFSFIMDDGSETPTATIDLAAVKQADYLGLVTTDALIVGGDMLDGVSLLNVHPSAYFVITANMLNIVAEPDNGLAIADIVLGGSNVYSGSSAQGIDIDVTDTAFNNEDNIAQEIEFGASFTVTNNFTVTYTMEDDSVSTNSLEALFFKASDFFLISTSDAKIYNEEEIKQVYLGNVSTNKDITITQLLLTWDTETEEEKITKVQINGSNVWAFDGVGFPNGKQDSGTLLDIQDYTISADTNPTSLHNQFYFSKDMNSKDITMEYIFDDATTVNAKLLLNPDSSYFVWGDDFETGVWKTDWNTSGQVSLLNSFSEAFSGKYYMSVGVGADSGTATLTLDLSGHSTMHIKFWARYFTYYGSGYTNFEISDDNGISWDTLQTWSVDMGDYVAYEFDLSSYDLETYDVKLRFDTYAGYDLNSLSVDNIFFFE
jgi:hypothetical protein